MGRVLGYDYTVDGILLKQVGSDYRFIHRLLLEHFAEMGEVKNMTPIHKYQMSLRAAQRPGFIQYSARFELGIASSHTCPGGRCQERTLLAVTSNQ
jgi:hypothetical protein